MSARQPIAGPLPGQKVDEYLRLMGALPGEFDDAEIVASARRIITMVNIACPDHDGKPHRAKSGTVYRVLTAFLAVAGERPMITDTKLSRDQVVERIRADVMRIIGPDALWSNDDLFSLHGADSLDLREFAMSIEDDFEDHGIGVLEPREPADWRTVDTIADFVMGRISR